MGPEETLIYLFILQSMHVELLPSLRALSLPVQV